MLFGCHYPSNYYSISVVPFYQKIPLKCCQVFFLVFSCILIRFYFCVAEFHCRLPLLILFVLLSGFYTIYHSLFQPFFSHIRESPSQNTHLFLSFSIYFANASSFKPLIAGALFFSIYLLPR